MSEFVKKIGKQRLLAIIIMFAVFLLLVIAGIIFYKIDQANQIKTYATVRNYSNLVPRENRKNIEAQLRNVLQRRFDIPDETEVVGIIRPKTIKHVSKNNTTTFLIDVDAYKQTFRVDVTIGKLNEEISDGIIIRCPKRAEMKYPEEYCESMYDNSDSLDIYLPYEGKLDNGTTFTAKQRLNDNRETAIGIYVISCGDSDLEKQALANTKKYFDDNKFDSNNYNFITIDVCTSRNSGL